MLSNIIPPAELSVDVNLLSKINLFNAQWQKLDPEAKEFLPLDSLMYFLKSLIAIRTALPEKSMEWVEDVRLQLQKMIFMLCEKAFKKLKNYHDMVLNQKFKIHHLLLLDTPDWRILAEMKPEYFEFLLNYVFCYAERTTQQKLFDLTWFRVFYDEFAISYRKVNQTVHFIPTKYVAFIPSSKKRPERLFVGHNTRCDLFAHNQWLVVSLNQMIIFPHDGLFDISMLESHPVLMHYKALQATLLREQLKLNKKINELSPFWQAETRRLLIMWGGDITAHLKKVLHQKICVIHLICQRYETQVAITSDQKNHMQTYLNQLAKEVVIDAGLQAEFSQACAAWLKITHKQPDENLLSPTNLINPFAGQSGVAHGEFERLKHNASLLEKEITVDEMSSFVSLKKSEERIIFELSRASLDAPMALIDSICKKVSSEYTMIRKQGDQNSLKNLSVITKTFFYELLLFQLKNECHLWSGDIFKKLDRIEALLLTCLPEDLHPLVIELQQERAKKESPVIYSALCKALVSSLKSEVLAVVSFEHLSSLKRISHWVKEECLRRGNNYSFQSFKEAIKNVAQQQPQHEFAACEKQIDNFLSRHEEHWSLSEQSFFRWGVHAKAARRCLKRASDSRTQQMALDQASIFLHAREKMGIPSDVFSGIVPAVEWARQHLL